MLFLNIYSHILHCDQSAFSDYRWKYLHSVALKEPYLLPLSCCLKATSWPPFWPFSPAKKETRRKKKKRVKSAQNYSNYSQALSSNVIWGIRVKSPLNDTVLKYFSKEHSQSHSIYPGTPHNSKRLTSSSQQRLLVHYTLNVKLHETGTKIPLGTTSTFLGWLLRGVQAHANPSFIRKLHQHLQCIKLGLRFLNTLIWISFSTLLACLQPHQHLNRNQLSELTQRWNLRYFIFLRTPHTPEWWYSSTVLLSSLRETTKSLHLLTRLIWIYL